MSLRLTDGDEERSWRWDDRSLWSRLGKRLISRSAHSEPRPQGAIFTSFSAACLSCSVGENTANFGLFFREAIPTYN